MKVLGIDTILHDVCLSVIEDNKILANEIKRKTIPLVKNSLLDLTIAHIEEIGELLEETFKKSGISIKDISLIAVNNSGSLLSNVLVGLITANTLSKINDIPLIDVSHQEGHIFSNWIERDPTEFNFPIIVFSASGGHSLIALITKGDFKFKTIQEVKGIKEKTWPGPSFVGLGALFSDIICHLGLKKSKDRVKGDGYLLSKLARKGNPNQFNFFSEKEKDVYQIDLNYIEARKKVLQLIEQERKSRKNFSPKFIFDLAASFENSLADMVINNLSYLAREYKAKEMHLVGGISANRIFRKKLREKTKSLSVLGRYPRKKVYCLDNAVMIANLGYYKFKQNPEKYLHQRSLNIKSDLILENLAVNQFLNQGRKLN